MVAVNSCPCQNDTRAKLCQTKKKKKSTQLSTWPPDTGRQIGSQSGPGLEVFERYNEYL